MEKLNPSVEDRVWQRIGAQPGAQRDDLRPLMLAAWEAAGDYQFLRTQLKGPGAEGAKQLWEGAQETIACLRGLQILRGLPPRKPVQLPGGQKNIRRVLEGSYHRARKMAAEYTARSADAACGMVFLKLAKREEEACGKIAGLLGQVGK